MSILIQVISFFFSGEFVQFQSNQTEPNQKKKKYTPALQHHVRGDDEFRAGEIFDGEIVAETD